MSRDAEFRRELDGLYEKRTDFIRNYLSNKRGARAVLTSSRLRETIRRLQQLDEDDNARPYAKEWFRKRTAQRRAWYVSQRKGHTQDQKRATFKKWYDQRIGTDYCVYLLWKGRRCWYVGRTKRGRGRPTAHFDKRWFAGVTRLDVYEVPRRRDLPTLECLAIHLHHPVRNKQKAATQKWTSKCPLCKEQKEIRDEVRAVFRLH